MHISVFLMTVSQAAQQEAHIRTDPIDLTNTLIVVVRYWRVKLGVGVNQCLSRSRQTSDS